MNLRLINTLMGVLCLSLALSDIGQAQWTDSRGRRDRDRRDRTNRGDREDAASQAYKAAYVFREIMRTPDQGIPKELLDRAYCVAVFPRVIKGGFIIGGRYGRGVASCRTKVGWSAPAYFNLGGGSFGLQIGAQATDFVFLFMSGNGMNNLLMTRFEIGGDASAAAGPIGRTVGAGADPTFRSQILTYSRSKGLFAGLELKGTVISQDGNDNRAVYGNVSPEQILNGTKPAPSLVKIYPNTLAQYSRRRLSQAAANGR
jgi:lipid-binding SYLF domain-containing protein